MAATDAQLVKIKSSMVAVTGWASDSESWT
jgi:hypothetical protein